MPLNDLLCRKAKPQSKPYKLYDAEGLYLEILPAGGKYWRYKYRIDGKEKRLVLGVYPYVSLMEARNLHQQAKVELKRGNDPVLLKQAKKQQGKQAKEDTFEKVSREFFEKYKSKWTERYRKDCVRRFETYLFPELGQDPINEITTPKYYNCLKKLEPHAPYTAKRINQKCSEVFRYAKRLGRADIDITVDVKGAFLTERVKHRASIAIDELPEFVKALESSKDELGVVAYLAVKIMMKTFVRRSELLKATWDEVDFDQAMWTIPGNRMKMRKEHLVPLARQTISDLKALYQLTGNRKHLFPKFTNPTKHISLRCIMQAIKKIGYEGKMSTHGFRALAMGICKQQLEYRHEIPDRQLAHAPDTDDRPYDRAEFLNDRIKMMQRLADYIDNPTQTPQPPTQRTTAHDRETTAIIPQSYPGHTINYRIYQSDGGINLPGYQ